MKMNLTVSIEGLTGWNSDYKEATKSCLQNILYVLQQCGHDAQFVEFDVKLAKQLNVNVITGKALPVKLLVMLRVSGTASAKTQVSEKAEIEIAQYLADLIRVVDPVWCDEPIDVTIAFWNVHTYQI